MALNSVVKVVGVVGYYPFWVATFLFMNPLYLQEHVLIFFTTVSPLSLHCGSSRQQELLSELWPNRETHLHNSHSYRKGFVSTLESFTE